MNIVWEVRCNLDKPWNSLHSQQNRSIHLNLSPSHPKPLFRRGCVRPQWLVFLSKAHSEVSKKCRWNTNGGQHLESSTMWSHYPMYFRHDLLKKWNCSLCGQSDPIGTSGEIGDWLNTIVHIKWFSPNKC